MRIKRREPIYAVVNALRKHVPYFKLVKPYEGEIDSMFSRYSRIQQVKSDIFPAEVQLQVPFALVISEDRNVTENSRNRARRFRHDISVMLGASTSYDFASDKTPALFDLLDLCVDALADRNLGITGVDTLTLVNHGKYIVKTELFTVYEQKYFTTEIEQ